jgi:hypothetical protein
MESARQQGLSEYLTILVIKNKFKIKRELIIWGGKKCVNFGKKENINRRLSAS